MAFESIRVAWPQDRLLHIDDQVLVVDKPRGIPVHGGATGFDDVVARLARLLRERQEPEYLAVHSRLDKEVSGVLVFGRDPSKNQAIAREFESHRVGKRYLAVVRDSGLPARFEMRDRLQPSERGPTRVVEVGGLDAITEGFVRARRRARALVELMPRTGRRHQIRAQLAHRGAAICGDTLYQGIPGPRLMLHAIGVESKTLGWQFDSPPPEDFAEFGLSETLGSPERLRGVLFDACWLREPLFRSTDAMRLVNASGDGLPGVAVDRFGDWAVVELFSDEAVVRRRELCEALLELGARGVYVKVRLRGDLRKRNVEELAPSVPDVGEPAPTALIVKESGLPFEVRLGDGWDVGVYLDQRENRGRIIAASNGRAVLNLFGYTATFSVAAALGGATRTVTVDISGRALDRARRNFEIAGLQPSVAHQFLRAEAVEWLERARRRDQRFDLVILDPPTFATTGPHRVFRLADCWDDLLTGSLGLLNPLGQMLVVSHEHQVGPRGLRRKILRAAERIGRVGLRVRDLGSAVDLPQGPDGPWPSYGMWVDTP
jgi:23S rRNA (cytosine1962-C5)-methyltransferase